MDSKSEKQSYLRWDEQTMTDMSPAKITAMYDRGYLFTRLDKGIMHQTRSVRINLKNFKLSSENRRIAKKTSNITCSHEAIPFEKYNWSIAKLAKDFYSAKFGNGTHTIMSAAKIKQLVTSSGESNFNTLFVYSAVHDTANENRKLDLGYAISYENNHILHYCYPFYNMEQASKDMGLGMMIKALEYAQATGKSYVYIGSLQRPRDTYKLQFSGIEWFDGDAWQTDLDAAKKILKDLEI